MVKTFGAVIGDEPSGIGVYAISASWYESFFSFSFALQAFLDSLFFALIIKLSAVGRKSNTPVFIVTESTPPDIALVKGSATIVDVSIQRG